MDDITATFTLRLTPEDLYALLSRTLGRGEPVPPAIVAAIVEATPPSAKGNEIPDSVSIPPTPNVTFNSPEPEAPTVAPVPLPPKPTRSRAKANGAEAPINATPLAPPPPPEPLDEPAMRSLLSKVGAVHPLKVKAITNILENCGGARRLSECDPATWPTIAEEAQKVLAEYGA